MFRSLTTPLDLKRPVLVIYLLLTSACFSVIPFLIRHMCFEDPFDLPFIPDEVRTAVSIGVVLSFLILPWFCAFFLRPQDRALKIIGLLLFLLAILSSLGVPAVT